MRTFFRSGRFLLIVLGFAISGLLFLAALSSPPPWRDLFSGVGASVLFVAGLDFLSAAKSYWLHRRRQLLFGRELARQGARFVYPDFVMNDDVKETLLSHNQQLLYKRPSSRYSGKTTHRADIPRVIADNDIRALLYISDIFHGRSITTEMSVDSRVMDDPECSFISIGLSSNDCTHLYLEIDQHPIFEIVPDDDGSEYLRMPHDGAEFRSNQQRQYGLLVRYSPATAVNEDRRWFFVAGLGPLGTTATAKYLAQHWKKLAKSMGPRDDFALIVSTGSGAENYPVLEAVYRRDIVSGSCERVSL